MKVAQVLHMNGGVGHASYGNNSLVQEKVICLTKPIREEAITSLYCNTVPRSLAVADLGCSSGPNTLLVVSEFIKIVEKLCRELNHKSPEYKVFLNDLPGNDFSNIFKSLDSFKEKLCDEMESGIGPCYFSGVPGSFYGRVFPNQSLHFVHSSYSLQWLSKVPEGVDNNRGNVYIGSTSPTNVARAYYEQFQRDFSLFLKCRAEELVKGGRMVLTFLGRRSDDPSSKDGGYIWELMATALNDMVLQGIIKEEQLDTFNIPQYTPSPSEVELEVLKEGSFASNRLEVSEVNWNAFDDWNTLEFESERSDTLSDGGYNVAQCMRAVAEPMLVSHFGEAIIEEVFSRYQQILTDRMSKEQTKFINVTVAQVLHMNGGVGHASYANNSLLQQKVICLTKPIREEAITSLYCNTVPRSLAVADLGCSSGPNTLLVVSEFIKIVEKLCRELNHKSPEYKVFLNDLPGNDFNNIFKSLDSFKEKLCDEMESGIGPCYFSGVPGSFYGRVFPNQSLHFVHSSYSLHWLSKVPEGVDNNRGNVYIGSTSPTNVARAYYEQFQRDFSLFLKCRAEELVKGGRMVLTFLGRRSDDPSSKDGGYVWELMATALNDMVLQGIIKEEQLDTFNIPLYTPSPSEVKLEVLKEGSFASNRLEVSEVNWNAFDDWNALEFESERSDTLSDGGYNVAQCMRAVAEPMLVSHFGEAIIEEVFSRYQQILTDRMSKEQTKCINVTVAQVLHMNGGVGHASYANNSLVQQKVICLTKPIREEAITSLYCNTVPRSLAVADLGCSSGPNTLLVVSEFIKIVEKLCRELNHKSPEYKVFLNDLPGNDFNNIFKSLDSFKEKLCDEMESRIGPCYFYGVPGSFYGRVFPNQSLHFVHSSYSLHWLSKVPEGVDNNRGNVYIGSTSPTNVARAYYEQFQRDFSLFLKFRAEELVKGGRMVLTFLGRRSDDPSSKDGGYIWELMATALNDMVLQGIIKEEKLDTFNIPLYTPSPSEVKLEVLKEGSFAINRLEVSEVNWNAFDDRNALEFESERSDTLSDGGYNVAQCMRAVAEPMLVSHFGEAIIEEVAHVLHMNGGVGHASYANNSLVQEKVICLTKPIREEAITSLYCNTVPRSLAVADLGCSSGPNTLLVVSEFIKIVEKLCRELNHKSPEYKVFLNDLPGNDFNNIFKSLDSFKEKLRDEMESRIGPCYFYGVPGSFYGRVFPNQSLHFVHSSYSLQWLSKVPEGVDNNRGNVYIGSTSPTNVARAYYEQFQRDFSLFLKCRAEELVKGGCMVLTFLGRRSDDPSSKDGGYIWELMATALNDMVLQGIIKEEQLDTFNIPQYTPSPSEVKLEVLKEGSFAINRLEVSEVNWDAFDDWNALEFESERADSLSDGGYNVAQCMRAVAEPMLVSHFGEAIIEEVFSRYQQILADRHALGRVVDIGLGRGDHQDSDGAPQRRRPTTSARRRPVLVIVVEDVLADSLAVPEVEPVVAGDAPMVDADAQDTGAETDAQDTGSEDDADELEGFPGGPRDPSVLTEYAEHVAASERLELKLSSHGRKVHNLGMPVPTIEKMVAGIELSPLIVCSVDTGDRGLISSGDEYFPSSSGGGIHHVGRRRVSSSSVDRWRIHDFQPLHSDEAVLLLVELLMVSPEVAMVETGHCGGLYAHLQWLRDVYQCRCQIQHWTAIARAYLLHLLGCTLFANKSATHVHVVHLYALRDLTLTRRYAWGAVGLVHIVGYMSTFRQLKSAMLIRTMIRCHHVRVDGLPQRILSRRYLQRRKAMPGSSQDSKCLLDAICGAPTSPGLSSDFIFLRTAPLGAYCCQI
ncbi:Salicylate carboxymethyltransferase [Glycine max]|nr:Salicylate carboxymethyltransferase [Glycine max]